MFFLLFCSQIGQMELMTLTHLSFGPSIFCTKSRFFMVHLVRYHAIFYGKAHYFVPNLGFFLHIW